MTTKATVIYPPLMRMYFQDRFSNRAMIAMPSPTQPKPASTLSYLIESEPEKALLFNDKLADVYRYILSHKDQVLIPLKEEIDFLSNYFTLLRLRFGSGVELVFSDDELAGQYLIPPVSIKKESCKCNSTRRWRRR